jgi:hypothetical protein
MFLKKLTATVLGLSLCGAATTGGSTARAGEGRKETIQAPSSAAPGVALNSSVNNTMSYSYKGKKVFVRLLNVKDRDWIGQCIDEDAVSITVQINNNVYQFFFSEIEYIESQ